MLKLTTNINDTTLPSSLLILNFCFFCNVLIGLFQLDSFLWNFLPSFYKWIWLNSYGFLDKNGQMEPKMNQCPI
jgi:hypothetical protein